MTGVIMLIILMIIIILIQIKNKKIIKTKTWHRPITQGEFGEIVITDILSQLSQEDYRIYNNIYVNYNGMSVQIDHLVISRYGVFVIETKNYSGKIYGYENSDNWIQYLNDEKYLFKNPIKQNKFHALAVKNILRISESAILPIVVFLPKSDLKCETDSTVIYSYQLYSFIDSKKEIKFKDESIDILISNLNNSMINHENIELKHIEEIKRRKEEYDECVENMVCPRCKGKLVERHGKYGKFIGCSNYPYCKFTK